MFFYSDPRGAMRLITVRDLVPDTPYSDALVSLAQGAAPP